jgi:hypothetical protein
MNIYLPIAELSVNIFIILSLGGAVGFLSGLLGLGGGFLMTPLLMFIGIPPAVAVATSANQIVAASVSGTLKWECTYCWVAYLDHLQEYGFLSYWLRQDKLKPF